LTALCGELFWSGFRLAQNAGRTGRLMNEVLTIKTFRADTKLYFAPENTIVGPTQQGCSRSAPRESEAEALMARGLLSRDPTHRARSKSLNFADNEIYQLLGVGFYFGTIPGSQRTAFA
jgi:hypothetical protein